MTPAPRVFINETILSQYGTKHGLEIYGKSGEDKVQKELWQIHYCRVVESIFLSELTPDQRRSDIVYLMFLKLKKTDITVEGIGCTD